MRIVAAVAASTLLAFLACVGDDSPLLVPPGDEVTADAAAEAAAVSSDGGTPTTDADVDDAADADAADVDAAPPCVTGETRSETRATNRVRNLDMLTMVGGFISAAGPAWLNPNNARTSDDQFATVSFPLDAGGAPNSESMFLVADQFGFDLPSAAVISGIAVNLEWRGNAAGGSPIVEGGPLGLLKAGAIYQAGATSDLPTNEGTTRFGDASALWDNSWDAPDVNDAGFGTAVSVRPHVPQTKTANAFVDAVSITVTYVCP